MEGLSVLECNDLLQDIAQGAVSTMCSTMASPGPETVDILCVDVTVRLSSMSPRAFSMLIGCEPIWNFLQQAVLKNNELANNDCDLAAALSLITHLAEAGMCLCRTDESTVPWSQIRRLQCRLLLIISPEGWLHSVITRYPEIDNAWIASWMVISAISSIAVRCCHDSVSSLEASIVQVWGLLTSQSTDEDPKRTIVLSVFDLFSLWKSLPVGCKQVPVPHLVCDFLGVEHSNRHASQYLLSESKLKRWMKGLVLPAYSNLRKAAKKNADCSYCGKRDASNSMSKCAGCRVVRYCGPQCQTYHWKVHKKMCKYLDLRRRSSIESATGP